MKNDSLTIAVASKDGISINLHFGHAHEFWIYQFESPQGFKLLEKRNVDQYCHGKHGSDSAMEKILTTINDCDAVMVAMVGDGPAAKLQAIDVMPIQEFAYESIEESLNTFAEALTPT